MGSADCVLQDVGRPLTSFSSILSVVRLVVVDTHKVDIKLLNILRLPSTACTGHTLAASGIGIQTFF